MQQIKKVLRIPKDPRTSKIIFLTEIPGDLLKKIEAAKWKTYIDDLNQIMLKKEKASIWNLFQILPIIPALLRIDTYEKEVRAYLEKVNMALKPKGIYIEDPSLNGYTELEIIISEVEK